MSRFFFLFAYHMPSTRIIEFLCFLLDLKNVIFHAFYFINSTFRHRISHSLWHCDYFFEPQNLLSNLFITYIVTRIRNINLSMKSFSVHKISKHFSYKFLKPPFKRWGPGKATRSSASIKPEVESHRAEQRRIINDFNRKPPRYRRVTDSRYLLPHNYTVRTWRSAHAMSISAREIG